MHRVLVINPNSNESVTDGLRHTATGFGAEVVIEFCTLAEGPFGIESDGDFAAVEPLVVEKITNTPDYDAYVIACYSDPGLTESRERTGKRVYGMQQSAIETAVDLGGRFGVLALSDESIARHIPYIERLGFRDQLAAELPLDISVDAAANDPEILSRVVSTGQRLVDEFGAGSIILGCAGMAAIADEVRERVSVPLIEPVRAAVRLATKKAP